ncbi:MAG: DUF5016 domain-containing protein [Candidatus Saccharibacteria bacterium]
MKNNIKFIILAAIFFSFWACKNDDVVVRYPRSTPKIDTATVAEREITYGDSIHLRVGVSDKVAPLSTLKVKIVVSNDEVSSEVIRTKGNHASIKRTYRVPFEANRPENAKVEIHLSSVNVSGTVKDTVVSSTTAKRPVISELYIVPDLGSGTATKLELVNADSLLYKATGLQYKTLFNYKLATRLDKFKRIDWSGMVFGKVGNGIGLIDKTGESITASDPTLVGISEFTFDALHFTPRLGGKLLEPVTTLDVMTDLPPNPSSLINNKDFRGGDVYFGENKEVTFSGITTDLANSISPDYFEVTGANKAKFLGKTGLYKAYYLTTANYLYIDPQPETLYPDALWICGTGFGRPSAPYEATASWNWNSPLDYMPCRLIAPGIYQATMYCKNTPNTEGKKYGTLDFKFFHKRGWWDGHEEWGVNYTVSPPFLGPTDTNGNINVLSEEKVDGVYRFTLNQNDKTIKAVKLK